MQTKALLSTLMIWVIFACTSFSASKRFPKMATHGGPDIVGADEQQSRYPALDLEDLCKQAKNPKCEAIIDNFCLKSCNPGLCSKRGSIRGMCRLMCEAEDLPPSCSNMGPSKRKQNKLLKQQGSQQQGFPQSNILPQ